MESLVSKLLQLADAGVGLGINVISLINTYAQRQMAPDPQPAYQTPPSRPAAPSAEAANEREYCIINRVELHPGSAVNVPFSINNEQADAARHVRLSVLGFTGATYGAVLPQSGFSVDPNEREIGPVDFDKFVLLGSIPAEAPPDVYSGWVLVEGHEEMRIPVMLMVSAPS